MRTTAVVEIIPGEPERPLLLLLAPVSPPCSLSGEVHHAVCNEFNVDINHLVGR